MLQSISQTLYKSEPMIFPTNISSLVNYLENHPIPSNHSVMLSIGETNAPDIDHLIQSLKNLEVDFFGGIFPSLIYGTEKVDEGILMNIFPTFCSPYLIEGLDTKNITLPNFDELPIFTEEVTALVLVDGLTSNISNFLFELYSQFGNEVKCIGGGAGSLSLKQQSCLFNKDGFFMNAAIVCPIKLNAEIGVGHGWDRVDGPFVATKTEKNIIKELNWKPAFDVYKEIVEMDSNQVFTSDNFFDIAKAYPLGMLKSSSEVIVRDPICRNDDKSLVCIGEVPENCVLEILNGNKKSLLNAAEQVVNDLEKPGLKAEHGLVFDCISRTLFLQDDFEIELSHLQKILDGDGAIKIGGALTLGEIASTGSGTLDFFNKTIVVGILYNDD